MSELKIEKGIPIPAKGFKRKYPFEKMEIGDSFFCSVKTGTLQDYISKFNKIGDKKFKGMKREENGIVGIRVWRIA